MKNFVYLNLVKQLLTSKSWDNAQCEILSEKIFKTYFLGQSDDELIIKNFINVILAIDDIRNKHIGWNKEIHRTNLFVGIIAEYVATLLSGNERTEKRIAAEIAKFGPNINFVGMKLTVLLTNVRNINKLLSYYENNTIVKNVELFNEKFNLQEKSTNDVMSELLELRQYGVKSSAFKDGIISAPNDYWIYLPADYSYTELYSSEFNWQMKRKTQILNKNKVAMVVINKSRIISTSPIPNNLIDNDQAPTFLGGIDCKAAFTVNVDGELSNLAGISSVNLRSSFERLNRIELYEMIRANAIFRLYDLVVPTIVHKKYNIPSFPTNNWLSGIIPRFSKFNPKLYLQRIRVLFDNLNEIKRELESEYDTSVKDNPIHVLKREHDVICHVRRLPEGYQASQKARDLAKQILNYELKSGETFVCNHTRNKGGQKADSLPIAVLKH